MRRTALMLMVLCLVCLPTAAFPWGTLTHFRGGQDLSPFLPPGVEADLFIPANAGPDLAWTPFFYSTSRTYIHSFEFADCLLKVACGSGPAALATALAWGVHLALDEVAHSLFVPRGEVLHNLVELAVDNSIYYLGSPLGWQPLPRYRLTQEVISPGLIAAASRLYQQLYDPGARLIDPWMVATALGTFDAAVGKEFQYIQSQGSAQGSERFLKNLALLGVLPGSWQDYYLLALDAGYAWLEAHWCPCGLQAGVTMSPVPLPSALILLGSGLAALALRRAFWA